MLDFKGLSKQERFSFDIAPHDGAASRASTQCLEGPILAYSVSGSTWFAIERKIQGSNGLKPGGGTPVPAPGPECLALSAPPDVRKRPKTKPL